MPKRKSRKIILGGLRQTRVVKPKVLKFVEKQNFWSRIKWGESYVSFVLGLVVIITSFFLVVAFLRNTADSNKTTTEGKQVSSTSTVANNKLSTNKFPMTYTVKKGDTLWSIAENFYNSGYNWITIAKENNLTNPSLIHAGNELKIRDVKPIVVKEKSLPQAPKGLEIGTSINGNSYTVVKGDNLWDIAVRAYGDGFRFVEIVKANSLANSNLIHPGNILKIPR